jgi:hypothetical protein
MGTLSQAADGHDCVLLWLFGLPEATCATLADFVLSGFFTEAFASRKDEFAVREGFANPGAAA